MKIGIVNNGIGNVGSVLSSLQFYKYGVSLLETPAGIDESDILVLTGVGSFASGVRSLRSRGFWKRLQEAVSVEKKPVLGLCLGMQLFASHGYENGEYKGFGWIPGQVVRLDDKDDKVPHIGWVEVNFNESAIFQQIRYGSFYFMHSYHFIPENQENVIATARHGSKSIVAAVRSENIVGLQFHPEKSQGDGLRILRNIMEEFACAVNG